MKKLIKIIPIIVMLLFGCLVANSFSDTINREIFAAGLEQRKIVVDHHLEDKFLEMERGKIPIGECVDEAEDLAQKIIDEMEIVVAETELEIQEVLEMRDEAEKQIYEVEKENGLIDLTSPGHNPSDDCVEECDDACSTHRICNCSTTCNENGCETHCTCHCAPCTGTPCPRSKIANAFNKIEKYYQNIETLYESIATRAQKISNAVDKIIDLIEVKNLSICDPDRWEILNKLLNSRYKMEECVQGFGSALKHPRFEVNLLSCRTAINEIETKSGELVLLGYFENKTSDYPYCYPYTANSAIRAICKDNKDSVECVGPGVGTANPYMDNYFCAGPFFDTGKEGGNKEGDEAPVCD